MNSLLSLASQLDSRAAVLKIRSWSNTLSTHSPNRINPSFSFARKPFPSPSLGPRLPLWAFLSLLLSNDTPYFLIKEHRNTLL